MHPIRWEDPFCGEGASCFRLGADDEGKVYIAVVGQEDTPLSDNRDALRSLITAIKSGEADHLL